MESAEQIRAKLERYETFVAQDPGNVNLMAEIAELRLRLGDFTEAGTVLDKALALAPENAALRSQQVVLAIATGEFDKAVSLARDLLAAGVNAPAVRYNLAYALMFLGRHAEATEHLQAISGLPDAPADTLVLQARALHHLGQVDEAKRCLQQYLAKNPDDTRATGALALLLLDDEELEAAGESAEKALKRDGENLEALVTLGSIALERQDSAEARKYFEHAVTRYPKSGRAWGGLGLLEMLDMQVDKAKADLEQAVRHMPDHIGTWHALAWARIVTDDLPGAEAAFAKSLDIDRNFGETHGGLAVVAALQGRTADAERLIKVALRLDPQSFAGRFAQSLILARRGDASAAQATIQKILSSPVAEGQDSLNTRLAKLMRDRRR